MALYGDITNTTVQKLIEAVALSIRQPNGTILTEYKDRLGVDVSAGVPSDKQATLGKTLEYKIELIVRPDGNSVSASVQAITPRGPQAISGPIDLAVLATKLV